MHACNDTQHFKRNLILRWMSNKNDDDKLHDKAAFMDGDNKKECSMANNQGCLFKAPDRLFGTSKLRLLEVTYVLQCQHTIVETVRVKTYWEYNNEPMRSVAFDLIITIVDTKCKKAFCNATDCITFHVHWRRWCCSLQLLCQGE